MKTRKRKVYTEEYKQETVRLIESSELPVAQIGRQLGIHRNTLDQWRKEYGQAQEHQPSKSTVAAAQNAELLILRQEVQALRQERDILKKALAIISREPA